MNAREEVLDTGALDQLRTLGGAELVTQMIDLFLEHGSARLTAAREASRRGDGEGVAREMHSLKSTAGSLGARRVQDLATQLEGTAKSADEGARSALLTDLEISFDRARAALTSVRESPPT